MNVEEWIRVGIVVLASLILLMLALTVFGYFITL